MTLLQVWYGMVWYGFVRHSVAGAVQCSISQDDTIRYSYTYEICQTRHGVVLFAGLSAILGVSTRVRCWRTAVFFRRAVLKV